MCGITGFYAFNEIGRLHGIHLVEANNQLAHRGPDSGLVFTENRMGLGHRRLSIIDLSTDGRQPMTDQSGRYTIVFNGEIFNYQSLKQDLLNKGINFVSATDTEVLLYLYIHEKEKCLSKLNGFFAFAIYDNLEDSLFLARDRYGIKPLVYFIDEDKFLFSSEINSLMAYQIPKELDKTAVFQYFQLHYIPAPNTIYQNVFKLLPAHYLSLKGREMQIKPYYELPKPDFSTQKIPTYQDAQKQFLDLLDDSVKLRLMADVPLGAFLSGGIDSSAVVALASRYQNLNTFSIGYQDEPFFDETEYANLVAQTFKTNHQVFKLSNDDLFEAIFKLLDFFGEPFADSSAIPFFILSQKTKEKVTVALSGDGADELFAGYNKYLGEYKVRENGFFANLLKSNLGILEKLPKSRNGFLSNKFRQFHRFSQAANLSAEERYWYLSSFFAENKLQNLFSSNFFAKMDQNEYDQRKKIIISKIHGKKDLNDFLEADVRNLLTNDMLPKVDTASMAHSLEVRVPFLDYRIVDFAFSLPSEYKINGQMKKRIVQDAFRNILPEKLYNRPKHGFDVPLAKGFQKQMRSWVEKMFDADFVANQGIFSGQYIKNLKKIVLEGGFYDQNHVWAILVFQNFWLKNQ
ncbi:MAG: asparagine synthase (glutamine-hydrolyzing) [Bacteroidetes bacterium]|nr:MAG: asparagine synthase (glutamine-hydrolyzing) [Bacteroidota bacterium]